MNTRIKIIKNSVSVEVDVSNLGFGNNKMTWVELQPNEKFKNVVYEIVPLSDVIILEIETNILDSIPKTQRVYEKKVSSPSIPEPKPKARKKKRVSEEDLIPIFSDENLIREIHQDEPNGFSFPKEKLKAHIIFKPDLLRDFPIEEGTMIKVEFETGVFYKSVIVINKYNLGIQFSDSNLTDLRRSKFVKFYFSKYSRDTNKKRLSPYLDEQFDKNEIKLSDKGHLEKNNYFVHDFNFENPSDYIEQMKKERQQNLESYRDD